MINFVLELATAEWEGIKTYSQERSVELEVQKYKDEQNELQRITCKTR